jgi:hypothetical protein
MKRLTIQRVATFGVALASVFVLGACDNGGGGGGGGGSAVPGVDKFRQAGPNNVTQQRVGVCTRFLPPMGAAGSNVGLGWGNGTGGSPATYAGILTRVASHGSLVTAANTSSAGNGEAVSQCITELANARADSNRRFAASGHSQGGSGAINASRMNALVQVTCPVQLDGVFTASSNPADIKGSRTSPALIMCGGSDNLAPCTRNGNGDTKFNGARVPVARVSINGASHFVPSSATGGTYAALVTTCVEALGGDVQAQQALSPGNGNNSLRNAGEFGRVAFRNF